MRSWNTYKNTFTSTEDLHEAARTGNVPGLVHLLSEEETLDRKSAKGYSPLMLAAYNGHLQAVNLLVIAGADINSTDNAGNSILMGVAFKGHTEILRVLMRAGANVHHQNHSGQGALQFAQMFGRFECVELLQVGAPKGSRWTQILSAWFGYFNPMKGERKAV